jgi:hypothetical protein
MRSQLRLAVLAAIGLAACSSGTAPVTTTTPAGPSTAASVSPIATPSVGPNATSSTASSASPIATTTTTARGCPAGQDGLIAQVKVTDWSLLIGGNRIPLTTAGIRNRSGDYQADDAIPQWAQLTSATPTVTASAGGKGVLAGSAGLRLLSGTVAVFPASAFDIAANRFPDPSTVTPRPLSSADGKLALAYPKTAGRWVLAFGVTWQTACLGGDGVAYVVAVTR